MPGAVDHDEQHADEGAGKRAQNDGEEHDPKFPVAHHARVVGEKPFAERFHN